MARFTSTLLLLATALTAVNAAPVAEIVTRQAGEPATVNFAPYAVVGCRMSQNPYDNPPPTDYNVTTGSGCITSSYTFSSYVEAANAEALGPCSFSLFSGPGCTGSVSAATLTSYENCIPSAPTAQSFELNCGP
ncbi:MAG: hypothetical protein LQ340_000359 [Diploschistes diacapsis]|nr:MAG: hypothetical protein LQ340_000359 [Diploschistes diacapsis]